MTPERDEMDEWREAHPEAALAEAISVAIGCILQHESDEAKRAAAINTLIECHRRACGVCARAAAALELKGHGDERHREVSEHDRCAHPQT
jgi:hypothetical protein